MKKTKEDVTIGQIYKEMANELGKMASNIEKKEKGALKLFIVFVVLTIAGAAYHFI